MTRVAALTGGTSTAILSRFLGLRAAASHVALLATVVTGDSRLVQAGRDKVVGLCSSKMSEVAGGCLGVRIVAGRRPLVQVQLAAILVRGHSANIVVGEMRERPRLPVVLELEMQCVRAEDAVVLSS